jgi:hypothetical protein
MPRLTAALAAILVVCFISGSALAQRRSTYGQYYYPPPASRLDRKVDGAGNYNIGRSAEAPSSESEKLFLTLITSDAYQQNDREKNLVSWFNFDPRLAKLRGSTRFNWYLNSNPHYRDRLRLKFGEALPIVAIQRPDGEVLLNVTAISMPRTSGELADMCDDAVNARYAPPPSGSPAGGTQIVTDRGALTDCPNCPDDHPQPGPDVDQPSDPINEVIPQRVDGTAVGIAVGAVVLLGFVVLAVGVMVMPRGKSNQLY